MRVLIVDDERPARDKLRRLLALESDIDAAATSEARAPAPRTAARPKTIKTRRASSRALNRFTLMAGSTGKAATGAR